MCMMKEQEENIIVESLGENCETYFMQGEIFPTFIVNQIYFQVYCYKI